MSTIVSDKFAHFPEKLIFVKTAGFSPKPWVFAGKSRWFGPEKQTGF